MNQALLMKICWGLISSTESLWIKVLQTKYGIRKLNFQARLPNTNCSSLWRSVSKMWNKTIMGAGWSIGNGEKARFWWDCWATKMRPLIEYATAPVHEDSLHGKVADFVNVDSQWKWESFSSLLLTHVLFKVASIQPPRPERGQDQIFWSASNTGNFIVRSAYHYLAGSRHDDKDLNWFLTWRWKGPQAICVFIWTVLHDRLKTKRELMRRHLVSNGYCDRCGLDLESTLHVLRDCPMTQRIWNHFVPRSFQADFYSKPLKEWIISNIQSNEQYGRKLAMGIPKPRTTI